MSDQAAVQEATLDEFIEAWKRWKPDTFFDTWTDNCTVTSLPFSLGVPTRSREEMDKLIPALMGVMSNWELTVHTIVHDTAHGQAAIYALSKADTPIGPYKNEHALFLWFDKSGKKVDKIEEMIDQAVLKDFFPRLQVYMEQQKS
ncbi:hypothetical protein VTH82DRAFT_1511 [Thermothelomyces myriococcoides]